MVPKRESERWWEGEGGEGRGESFTGISSHQGGAGRGCGVGTGGGKERGARRGGGRWERTGTSWKGGECKGERRDGEAMGCDVKRGGW